MELITKAPKGTVDLVPGKSEKWQVMEDVFRSEAELNGFAEIRTPVFEHTELFLRGVGDTTDVVEKQMYTFEDKGGRSITLRPEGTAGAVRAMLENGLYNAGYPVKLYYLTSCYRYEKPQAGRLRELHQFGVEMFGAAEPVADAQIIALALSAFHRLGLEDVGLQINSIGCPECRKEYHKALKEYFTARKDQLCDTCLSRLERNPMRILDCKSPECQEVCKGAPKITDYLCADCQEHFQKVQDYLIALGVEFEVDPGLVRGLEEMGGKPTAGLGFGLGLDRIMMALEAQKTEFPQPVRCEVYLASMGEEAQKKAFLLTDELHHCGVPADCDLCGRGLKAQMKYADKIGAQYTIVLGENELAQGKAELKNMKTGEKKDISLGEDFIDQYITLSTQAADLAF